MIGRLRGILTSVDGDGVIVVDVGGIGYELACPLGTVGRAKAEVGSEVTLAVHTHAREDQLTLVGFAGEVERAAFRTLLGVPNVGPKLAIAILGELDVDELRRAVQERNIARLRKVSGIGAKTAEVLTVQLRDKLPAAPASSVATARGTAAHADGKAQQLHAALVSMGYKPSKADLALDKLAPRIAADPLATLLKDALSILTTS